MATLELKKYLVSKINQIDDDLILNEIVQLIDKKESTVYQLSEEQINLVNEAKEQFKNGDFIDQDEMDRRVEAWKKRK
jgi:hypothetical protein